MTDIFPVANKNETAIEYAKRCMTSNKVAKVYPNRKERYVALKEHFKSIPAMDRNHQFPVDQYLTTKQVAEVLDIRIPTLQRWIKRGLLTPYVKYVGKKKKIYVYHLDTVELLKEVVRGFKRKKQKSDSD